MLKKAVLGWPQIAGLGISLVIAGQFSGWNFGLADNGWANMLLATLLMAILSCGLALCISELSTAMPHAGGVFAYAQSAFGPFVGYLVGSACTLALTIGTGAAASFVGWMALIMVPAWNVVDRISSPAQADVFLAVRLACDVPIAVAQWALWRGSAGRRYPEWLTFFVLCVVQAEIAWMKEWLARNGY